MFKIKGKQDVKAYIRRVKHARSENEWVRETKMNETHRRLNVFVYGKRER